MIIITAWTKVVADDKVLLSGIITAINIVIWYYVLRIFVEDIANINILIIYTLGCVVGTMLTTFYFKKMSKK